MSWVLVYRRPKGPLYARGLEQISNGLWPYTSALDFAQEFSTEQAALACRAEHPRDGYGPIAAGPWIAVPLAQELLEREAARR